MNRLWIFAAAGCLFAAGVLLAMEGPRGDVALATLDAPPPVVTTQLLSR